MPSRILRLLVVLCVLVVPACAGETAPACGGTDVRLATPGKLTIATDYSYPPFAFRSPKNDLVGFEVEVAKHIAKQLKLEPFFVNRGTGALVTGLLSRRHDLALSGLRSDPDLQEQACVSAPFLAADLGILVPAASGDQIGSVGDLDGHTVAVLDGSDAERYALDNLDGSAIASLPTTDDLLTALQEGRSEAVVADMPFVAFSATRSKTFAVGGRIRTGEGYVIAGAKDNGPLMRGVNDAIARLKKAGTIAKLEKKWFGT